MYGEFCGRRSEESQTSKMENYWENYCYEL